MKNQIAELKNKVNAALTFNADGRQIVANACKDLYNLIEEALYAKYGERAVNDAYNDLCSGNFSQPFMCEQKKSTFELYAKIYIDNIA
jgi:hypothetical protein